MHTSGPRLREDGHSRRAAVFRVLLFAAILRKKRAGKERDRERRAPSRARGPEPRRPSYAARITVSGAHDAGGDWIGARTDGQYVAWQQRGRRLRHPRDVRHAAAEPAHIGIEHADPRPEGTAQSIQRSGPTRLPP